MDACHVVALPRPGCTGRMRLMGHPGADLLLFFGDGSSLAVYVVASDRFQTYIRVPDRSGTQFVGTTGPSCKSAGERTPTAAPNWFIFEFGYAGACVLCDHSF